jgi:hypothetical protein
MKLGEQWIEMIDGQEHMVKAVEKVSEKSYDCTGCIFNGHNGTCMYHSQDCPLGEVEHGYIKDLGILKDGRLHCPFCGEYPTIKSGQDSDGWSYVELACGNYLHRMTGYLSDLESFKQQLIDAWNRRA